MIVKLLILSTFIFRHSICENNKTNDFYDYCIHPDCSLKNQHTMCAVKNKQSSRLFASGLTPWMRYQILLLHNKHRDNIAMGLEAGQPKAANMRKMYWDYELEDIAQAWARQCQKRHDECRNTIRFNVLQNMDVRPVGPQVTEAQLLADAVGSWFSGSRSLFSDHIHSFKMSNCSAPGGCNAHWYSAAIWASTWRMGCSQALCTMKKRSCVNFRKRRTMPVTRTVSVPTRNITLTSTTENILRRTKYFTMSIETKIDSFDTTISNEARESLLYRGAINISEKRKKREETKIIAYTFCNYGPAGNIEGFPIYEVGNTCTNCPQGTSCIDQTHRGLCSVLGDPDSKP